MFHHQLLNRDVYHNAKRTFSKGSMGKYIRSLFYFSALAHSSTFFGATYTVNSLADTNTGTGTTGTLRYCINQANNTAGPNTIEFGTSGINPITLTQSLPPIGSNINIIDTMGFGITINGASTYQAFFISPSSAGLTFQNTGGGSIAVQNAASIGGNGGQSGGGGALGAGGGLFIGENNTVTLQGVSFSGCFAKGGNGASNNFTGSGGGGGMSQGTGGNGNANGSQGGGGGGGYGGVGGNAGGSGGGGGGGGGLFLTGGNGGSGWGEGVNGGGGGSDGTVGQNSPGSNGGNDLAGNLGGLGGSPGMNGGNGTGNSGGGGGGGSASGNSGSGGNSQMGAGGGGACLDQNSGGGNGGNSTGSFGGGGGGGSGIAINPGSGGNGGFGGGGGGGASAGVKFDAPGGNGGFGGGGGAINALISGGVSNPNVGNGGFGGGGGTGGYTNSSSGLGGYGASNGKISLFNGGGGAALGGTIFVSKGATLNIMDFPATVSSGTSTAGSGGNGAAFAAGPDIFLMSGGTISFEQATTFTINTPIASDGGAGGGSGGGLIMNNASGTLVLGGVNTYTDSTSCLAGTIQISQDANLGANANAVTLQNGGNLEFTGSGTINSSRVVTIGTGGAGLIVDPLVGVAIAGPVTGSGLLTKTGTGALELQNIANNYSGGTQINQGTVQVSNILQQANPINLGTGGVALNGGALEVFSNYGNNQTISNALTVSASSQILSDLAAGQNLTFSAATALNAGTLTIGQAAASNTLFSGAITGVGALLMNGPGNLVLSGSNTFGGGLTISAGAVQINTSASLPAASPVVNNSQLVFNFAGAGGPYTGGISGTGSVTVQNGGVVTLAGSNSYTGQTNIAASSTLNLNTASSLPLASNVVDNGTLVFNFAGAGGPYTGSISGAGTVTVQNGGSVMLSGTNTYTGQTNIAGASTLVIAAQSALPSNGNVVNNGLLNFNYAASGTGTVGGVISGSGTVSMLGAGTAQLSNSGNSYSGGTTISSGTVQVLSTGALGTGTLTFNAGTLQVSATSFSLSNAIAIPGNATIQVDSGKMGNFSSISGAGNLTTVGPGLAVLQGAAAHTGTTTVQSGTLAVSSSGSITASSSVQVNSSAILSVNGSVASPVLVNLGGTLKGLGPFGNTVTVNGTIAPGNSINTMVGTDFIFNPGATYEAEISNSTTDLISASGTVTINGGQLLLIPRNFSAPAVSSYTVITAGTVTNNTPFTFVNPLTRYSFNVVYSGTNVTLVFNGGPFPFNTIVTKGNAGKVAQCFEVLYKQNHPDLDEIITILELQTNSQMAKSFNEMQPANANNIAFTEENVAERIRQLYTEHFFEQGVDICYREKDWNVWASPFIENVRQHGDASLPGYQDRFTGFTAALDYYLNELWMFTGGFSFASTEMKVPDGRTRADYYTYAGSLGAAWTNTSFFADAIFSYLYSPIDATRKMHFSINHSAHSDVVDRKAKYEQGSNQLLGHLGGGYYVTFREDRTNSFNLYPFANLDYQYLMQSGYTESGAHSLDLKVRDKEYDLLRPEVGIGMGYKGCFEKRHVLIDLSFSYIHEFRFMGQKTTAKFKPADCTFTVKGLKPENNLFSPSLKIRSTSPLNGFSFMLGYHGEYGRHFILNVGEAEISKAF